MSDTIPIAAAAVLGALFGLAADRVSVRWPEHEPDYRPRSMDWRTALLVGTGAVVAGGLVARVSDPRDLAVLALYSAALMVLLATDLDQKLLPDLVTLPLIAYAGIVLILGWSPALSGKEFGVLSGVIAAVVAPAFLLVMDRLLGGELGLGDVKLSVSLGLLFGISLLFYGLIVASVGFALVLILLIAARRLGLKSAVPFGPVLIFAAFVAALLG